MIEGLDRSSRALEEQEHGCLATRIRSDRRDLLQRALLWRQVLLSLEALEGWLLLGFHPLVVVVVGECKVRIRRLQSLYRSLSPLY